MSEIISSSSFLLGALAGQSAAAARSYARTALSGSTLRAYRSDWAAFRDWCSIAGLTSLPAEPETVASYLATLAHTHKRATLRRKIVAIGQVHQLAGHVWNASHPLIRATLRGILRQHGLPRRQAQALGIVEIRKLVSTCDGSLTGLRDRALFLLGFAGA